MLKDKFTLGNDNRTSLGRAIGVATTFFYTYVVLCVIYATANLFGYASGMQVVIKETHYVKTVDAVSPIAK